RVAPERIERGRTPIWGRSPLSRPDRACREPCWAPRAPVGLPDPPNRPSGGTKFSHPRLGTGNRGHWVAYGCGRRRHGGQPFHSPARVPGGDPMRIVSLVPSGTELVVE